MLSDVSFEAKPGELIAIVGPTGSGKTTIMNLLHRFYDPTSGRLTVDGHDVKDVRLDSLYRQIALVPQDTILFGGPIRDNIRYGREDATEEKSSPPAKPRMRTNLSRDSPTATRPSSEKRHQSLRWPTATCRDRARDSENPRILLLDEATSALDTESERLVQEALEELMVNRTTFVVAHRLSTIQRADRILVLNKGKIVESGTHAALLEQRGLYHYLYITAQRTPRCNQERGPLMSRQVVVSVTATLLLLWTDLLSALPLLPKTRSHRCARDRGKPCLFPDC